MQTILVPVDGSVHALKAVHIAGDLVEKYDGKIHLLYVVDEAKQAEKLLNLMVAKNFGPKLRSLLQAQAKGASGKASKAVIKAVGQKILEQAAAKVRHRGLSARILAIEEGDPVEAILIATKAIHANTIVLGSRGVSQSKRSSFGSVSNAVFERAECTCLAVK
ncbi:MAG: universal stress protein [Devosiaceae bacterium]|nr:universal stress protein [Devosiaceae bacterium]